MKVKTLIKKLEKIDPEAEVRLHDKTGDLNEKLNSSCVLSQ